MSRTNDFTHQRRQQGMPSGSEEQQDARRNADIKISASIARKLGRNSEENMDEDEDEFKISSMRSAIIE